MARAITGVAAALTAATLGGCTVVSVVDTAVGTAVDVTATAVETTVDVAAGAVDLATPDSDDD